MADIVLGCDSNGVNDKQCQETVAKILRDGGHSVENLGIDPNSFANYSYSDKASGKIGVYLMAASLISFLDASDANFSYNVLGIRGDVTSWGTDEGFQTKGVPQDHDGSYSHPRYDECAGKTYPELNQLFQGKCIAVPGDTHEKLGQNILTAVNTGSFGGSSQNQNATEEEEEEWDDKDNFTPHKGKIMEIKPYKAISSISFEKSYDSPSGTGSVELLFSSKDYRFIYKGVAMKLKLRRTCDDEWSATGLEEPDYDESEKFFKEHIPTTELLKELGLPNYKKERKLSSSSSVNGSSNSSTGSSDSSGSSEGSISSSSSSSVRRNIDVEIKRKKASVNNSNKRKTEREGRIKGRIG